MIDITKISVEKWFYDVSELFKQLQIWRVLSML